MKSVTLFGISLAALPAVLAQVSEWGQCGGMNWTGGTTCTTGNVCVYQNPWYSQCLPGTSSSSASSTSSVKPSTSSSSLKPSSSSAKPSSSSVKPSSSSISTLKSSSVSSSTVKPSSSSQASSTSSAPQVSGTNHVKTWFSFGDSYTQTGFVVTDVQPSVNDPFGNPAYPGYTACGSYPNWIDYDATVYNSTVVEVFNHAYGGATIDATLVAPYETTVLSLVDQVNNFLAYDAPGMQYYSGWSSANTLFSIWIGINDIGNTYYLSGDRGAFDDTLLDRYFQLVQLLYNAGARHFLFLGVPPVDRSPLMVAQGTAATSLEASVIADYNTKLSTRAAAFASANAGATAIYYDTAPVINAVLNSPATYGLQDSTSYGTGNQYAWCNNYHISPPIHQQLAISISAVIKGTYI